MYLHRIYTNQVPVEDPADDSEGVIGDIVDETDCEGRPCSCHAMDYRSVDIYTVSTLSTPATP